jgi:tetratricopeptide (TPR) repeat protein
MLYQELDDLRGQAKVLSNLGVMAYWKGAWNDAIEYWERSNVVVQRTGDEVTKAFTTLNIAEIKLDQGLADEAQALLDGVIDTLRAAGDRTGTAVATLDLGRAAYQSGRYVEAIGLLEHAHEELSILGVQKLAFEASARMAECRMLAGEASHALALADRLLAKGATVPGGNAVTPLLHRIRGQALQHLGDHHGASDAHEQSLASARSRRVPFDTALALRALADLDQSRRDALLEESRELLRLLMGTRTSADITLEPQPPVGGVSRENPTEEQPRAPRRQAVSA